MQIQKFTQYNKPFKSIFEFYSILEDEIDDLDMDLDSGSKGDEKGKEDSKPKTKIERYKVLDSEGNYEFYKKIIEEAQNIFQFEIQESSIDEPSGIYPQNARKLDLKKYQSVCWKIKKDNVTLALTGLVSKKRLEEYLNENELVEPNFNVYIKGDSKYNKISSITAKVDAVKMLLNKYY